MIEAETQAGGNHRIGTWIARVLVVMIILITCWPYLANPQLEADDFRYLAHVQQLETNPEAELLPTLIVENRWDHLWWIDIEGKARFFRPTVVLSFWFDKLVWGEQMFFGLLLSNTLLHVFCSLLVLQILVRMLGPGWGPWVGAVLFAAFSCHAEVLWYVSGRTDTMAAFGFILALALHMRAFGGGNRVRLLALPAFAFALFTKELSVALPLVAVLADVWTEKRGQGGFVARVRARLFGDLGLYGGYVAVVAIYLAVRFWALGSEGAGGLPYPYAVRSFGMDFVQHLGVQTASYIGNLFFGWRTPPFVEMDNFDTPWWAIGLGLCWIGGFVAGHHRDSRFWWFVVLAMVTWLPTCFVYVSERYLYLPSFALAGVFALSIQKVARIGVGLLGFLVALGLVWTIHQASELHWKHSYFARPRNQYALARHFESIADEIRKQPRRRLLLLNFPGDWADAQFLQYQLRVNLEDRKLEVRVLSLMPEITNLENIEQRHLWEVPRVEREDDRTIVVRTRGRLIDAEKRRFPTVRLEKGVTVENERLGFRCEVLAGEGKTAQALRLRFERPLEDYILVRFIAPPPTEGYPTMGAVIGACGLKILRLPPPGR